MISIPSGRDAGRLLGAATSAIGAAFLIWPRGLSARVSGGHPAATSAVVRVLGGRQLVQGLAQIAVPKPDVVLAGITIDLLHAASMAGLALGWPAYRRAALASGAIAVVSAAAGAAVLVTDRDAPAPA